MSAYIDGREADDTAPVVLIDREGKDYSPSNPFPVGFAAVIPVIVPIGARSLTGIPLFVAATLAATSQVIDRGTYRGPAALVFANVGTGSPTVNVDIQGSVDNINFFNLGYALVATPNTVAVAQIAITATATTTYLLVTDQAWRFMRVVTSTVVTETYSVTYYQ